MEFLIVWIITIVSSFCLNFSNELRMLKDVADGGGYKINGKRILEIGKQLTPNASKITILSMIIPMFNIMQVFQRAVQYNKIRPMVIDQLRVIDALEEMSEIEKEEYQKNPTGLNALFLELKAAMEKYGDKETVVNILSNDRNIDLSDIRVDKKVEETTSKISQELSISEQKQILKKFRDELLEEKIELEESEKNDGSKLINKRK